MLQSALNEALQQSSAAHLEELWGRVVVDVPCDGDVEIIRCSHKSLVVTEECEVARLVCQVDPCPVNDAALLERNETSFKQ